MRTRVSLLVLGLSLVTGVARAKPPEKAEKLFAKCVADSDAGQLESARACFERVYLIYPSPVVLYNLGLVEEALDRPVEAYERYRRCTTNHGGALPAEDVRDAQQRLEALGKRLAFVQVRVSGEGFAVVIDGQPRGLASESAFPMLPGEHTVKVLAAGFRPWSQSVRLKKGEVRQLVPRLEALPSTPVTKPTAASAPALARRMREAQSLEAETLLERALEAEAATDAPPDHRAKFWCSLAEKRTDNPYLDRAKEACAELRPAAERRSKARAAMLADHEVVKEYLRLARKTDKQKVTAIRAFFVSHAALSGDPAYDDAARDVMARCPVYMRRTVCNGLGKLPQPRIDVTVEALWSTGAPVVGIVFAGGERLGRAPGPFRVGICTRIGVSDTKTGAWQEADIPHDGRARVELKVVFPRFVVRGGEVLDARTGLRWQRVAALGGTTWWNAGEYCRTSTQDGGGWRLPSRDELMTLVEKGAAPTIDSTAFPGTPADVFWSSSARSWAREAWGVHFATGAATWVGELSSARVRCVR